MKHRILLAFSATVLLALSLCACGGTPVEPTVEYTEIKNSMLTPAEYISNKPGVRAADPTILYADGKYYMYATSIGTGYLCWESQDLSNWIECGVCFERTPTSWDQSCHWAPCVRELNGKYYMFYTASPQSTSEKYELLHMGLAVSDSPKGPFTNVSEEPLITCRFGVVDPYVFVDDDGKVYLYYNDDERDIGGMLNIVCVELASDFSEILTEPKKVLSPEEDPNSWERAQGKIVEGTVLLKHDGKYYLMYSSNSYAKREYAVGYAVSDSPMGPFVKYENNPILKSNDLVSGPGHHDVIASPDGSELFCVYHAHRNIGNPNDGREIRSDRIAFTDDGRLLINGPTYILKQPFPSGSKGYTKLTDVYTISSDCAVTGDFSVLSDDFFAQGFDGVTFGTAESSSVTIDFEQPENLAQLWVYPHTESTPASVCAIINNQYKINDLKFADGSVAPVVFSMKNLPEGTKVETVELIFTPAEGADSFALSEIFPMTKN